MIYFIGAIWLFIVCGCVSISRDPHVGKIGLLFMSPFVMVITALFLEQLRFAFPIEWRARWPKWDAFLCRVGSHRCVPICGSRCCWECIRCNADSPSVKAYFERLERLGVKSHG